MAFWDSWFGRDAKALRPVKIGMVKSQLDPTLPYARTSSHLRTSYGDGFIAPEYDLAEIGRAEDCEAYVMQGHLKKVALMFKEGWVFQGRDERYVRYVETRIRQIAQASGRSFWSLLTDIGKDLVRYSNAYLVKVRGTEDKDGRPISGGLERKDASGGRIQPIAAYFHLSPETVEIKRNKTTGRIEKYRQRMPDGTIRVWPAENVIHFVFNRKGHFDVGTPTLTPVLDDIRALRKIEQNIEILIHQHLFPLYQYIVGTEKAPAGVNSDGLDEVMVARSEVEYMPSDGIIVTPERHEIRSIGAEGRALKVEAYLEHFKRRIIAGMGMSQVDFGEGGTSNRNTADSMSKNLIGDVKFYQQVLSDQIQTHIVHELLLESAFDGDVLSSETMVSHRFKDIDVDDRIKRENHAMLLYQSNVVTIDEARELMNRNPFEEGDEDLLNLNMVEIPLIKAKGEMDIEIAKESPRPVGASSGGGTKSPSSSARKSVGTKSRPQNQFGVKSSPEKRRSSIQDSILSSYDDLHADLKDLWSRDGEMIDRNLARQLVISVANEVKRDYASRIRREIAKGSIDMGMDRSSAERLAEERGGRVQVRFDSDVDRLFRQTERMIGRILDGRAEDKGAEMAAAFNSLRYRTRFIDDTDMARGRNFGRAAALRALGNETAVSRQHSDTDDICRKRDGSEIGLKGFGIDEIPPWHPECQCSVERRT